MSNYLINFLTLVFWFIALWIPVNVLHELFHAWALKMQGSGYTIKVWFWKFIPSLVCSPTGTIKNRYLFYFSGGVLAGLVCFLSGLLLQYIYMPIAIPLIILGFMEFNYGIYEGLYGGKIPLDKYMREHYIIYAVSFIIAFIVLIPQIIGVVTS